MSGPSKITDHRRPIVEPGGFVWPWSQGGTDLDLGQSAINSGVTFREQTVEVGPQKAQRRPRIKRSPAFQATQRPGVLNGVLPLVIGVLAVFHASPHISGFLGLTDLLFSLAAELPFGEVLSPAARAWGFAPLWVWAGALVLRVVAIDAAKRSAMVALTLAVAAFLLEAGAWIVLGAGREGQGPLVTLLLVEGAVLLIPLILLWLYDRNRRRQDV